MRTRNSRWSVMGWTGCWRKPTELLTASGYASARNITMSTRRLHAFQRQCWITYKLWFGYILVDALSSLTRGLIPATLIPPEVLRKVHDGLRLDRMREAIYRSHLMTYNAFELVDSTVIRTTGNNVLVNIPFITSADCTMSNELWRYPNLLTMELQQSNVCSESLTF